jgi:hypothetical protein
LLGATVASVWKRGAAAVSSRVSRLTILLPPGQQLDRGFPPVAISPSGTHVAYVGIGDGRQQLYLRAINEQEIRRSPGPTGQQARSFLRMDSGSDFFLKES